MRIAEMIIRMALAGNLSQQEAAAKLEILKIHGAFSKGSYIGYDYNNQEWLEIKGATKQ